MIFVNRDVKKRMWMTIEKLTNKSKQRIIEFDDPQSHGINVDCWRRIADMGQITPQSKANDPDLINDGLSYNYVATTATE